MKLLTIVGTRPELIRLSKIIRKLDNVLVDKHKFIYTGQNFDVNLSDIFFKDLNIPKPFAINKSGKYQLPDLMNFVNEHLDGLVPDKVLILGDTNSCLAAAICAEQKGIPVYHMEAGNRCFDRDVPEERNRRMIDAVSTFNLCYTEKARQNLLKENFPTERIWVSGNPIKEVMDTVNDRYVSQDFVDSVHINFDTYYENIVGGYTNTVKPYVLLTCHRKENIHNEYRMDVLWNFLKNMSDDGIKIIWPVHPSTNSIKNFVDDFSRIENLMMVDPLSFSVFYQLQKDAALVITDSGTVQEETAILGKKCLTIRKTTERPETVEMGTNVVMSLDNSHTDLNDVVTYLLNKDDTQPTLPLEYHDDVSDVVTNIIMGGVI